ncbi:efflux RND transporter periplasmic adaptor subunit [Riemerella anatipestifer]|uniref:efflux RND transporter periplasmic adaptor subunit n=1 Tax=Riemerella anatipestifer TaxID=34085 RepID=UPI0030C3B556
MKKIIIILSIGSIVLSCSKKENTTEEPAFEVSANQNEITLTDAQMKSVGIQTTLLSEQEISSKITLNGNIDVPPQGMASVSSPSGGYVKSAKFMPGNFVNKGDVLAILEDPNLVQLQQDYLLAKSNFGYAEKDYQRQKDLNQSQASSDKAMQMAHTEAKNQNISINALAERLRILGVNPDKITPQSIQRSVALRAPISGYITRVNVNIGQYVSPVDKLFEIVNTQDTHLILKAFEKDLSHLKIGQKVYAYANQNPNKKYTASIILIGKNFDSDRSVPVHCHFVGGQPDLVPGSFMNADVEANAQNSLSVPDDAVLTWEGKQYIFEEIKPKTFRMVPVTIGNSENGYTEISGDLTKLMNKKFVTKGAYNLLMGLKNVEE